MNNSEMRYVIDNSDSRSAQKLAIMMNGFFSILTEDKMKDLGYFEIVWQEFAGELVPRLVTSFGPKPMPVPTDESEKLAQLYEELRGISNRYDVSFVTAKQGEPTDPIIEVKRTDPFTEMNTITLVKNRGPYPGPK